MTSVTLARVGTVTDEIDAEARHVDLGRALLLLLAFLPFVLGWLVGATVTALSWAWAALVVGYRTAQRAQEDPDGAS